MLEVCGLSYSAGPRPVLQGIDLTLAAGGFLLVFGRNGAGKSTLLRLLAGRLRANAGQVRLAGCDLAGYSRRELARHVSFLPQADEFALPMLVSDVLLAGRYPYRSLFRGPSRRDIEAFDAGVAQFGLEALLPRNVQTLSGGERKKVLLAAAFIQDVPLILLDEPLNFLDPGSAQQLTRMLSGLHRNGRTIVVVSHEIERFFPLATRMLALDAGRARYSGPRTFSTDLFRDVYGIPFQRIAAAGRELIIADE